MQSSGNPIPRTLLAVALATTVAAALWLGLNIEFNYQGHLSGLFYTGLKAPLPEEMAALGTYRVDDDRGYDGQFYRLVAHDPLLRRGFLRFVDNPQLRWRRIGVPGLAALLVLGNDRYVDDAYVAVELLFVFLGAFWLARCAQLWRRSAVWGAAFLLIPAVAVSLDRMTVDLPLATLTIGFALFGTAHGGAASRPRWPFYLVVCAMPLVRETGMVLVFAWCLYASLRRDWRGAAIGAACAVPALAWWAFVYSRTPPDATHWLSRYPFSGLIDRTFQGIAAPVSTLGLHVVAAAEQLAALGIWLALGLALYLAARRRWGLLELAAMLFVAFSATLGKFDIWSSAYAFGRTMSPLLIVLGLLAFRDRKNIYALPLLLILPRIALQFGAQIKSMLGALS